MVCLDQGPPSALSQGHLEGTKDVTDHLFPVTHVKQRLLETGHFETCILFYLLFLTFETCIYLLLPTVGQGLGRSFV